GGERRARVTRLDSRRAAQPEQHPFLLPCPAVDGLGVLHRTDPPLHAVQIRVEAADVGSADTVAESVGADPERQVLTLAPHGGVVATVMARAGVIGDLVAFVAC